MSYIVEEPTVNEREEMSGSIFGGVYYEQVRRAIVRQSTRCPPQLPEMLDTNKGLTSDNYFNAGWNPAPPAMMYMAQIIMRIEQLESRNPTIRSGGNRAVTNILASNDNTTTVQITGWEPHNARLSGLEIGKVSILNL